MNSPYEKQEMNTEMQGGGGMPQTDVGKMLSNLGIGNMGGGDVNAFMTQAYQQPQGLMQPQQGSMPAPGMPQQDTGSVSYMNNQTQGLGSGLMQPTGNSGLSYKEQMVGQAPSMEQAMYAEWKAAQEADAASKQSAYDANMEQMLM